MKFLDAKNGEPRESITQKDIENKMHKGTRSDQKLDPKDPQSLISGSQGGRTSQSQSQSGTKTVGHAPSAEVTKLAAELNVDLKTVKGSGTHGVITESDVRAAAK